MQYTALEKLRVSRPVSRLSYLAKLASGKVVIDLGALDETAYQLKGQTDAWLHKRLSSVAVSVLGLDNSTLIPDEGLRPFDNSHIIRGDIFNLKDVVEVPGDTDLIVAGELIEHLQDAPMFLSNLKRDFWGRSIELVLTTPNACSWHNVFLGIFGRESMHPGHLNIYSYKTLNTLFSNAGFESWELIPYRVHFSEMIETSTGPKKWITMAFQSVVNSLEWCFPLLSCGWVCRVRI